MLINKTPVSTEKIEQEVNDLMRKADSDLDNRISLKELVNFTKREKEILTIFKDFKVLNGNISDEENKVGIEENFKKEEDEFEEDSDIQKETRKGREERNEIHLIRKEGNEFSAGAFKEEEMAGTQFSAVKPWKSVVLNSVPSDYDPQPNEGHVKSY